MSFHIATPADRLHYRKMSGPELGSALVINQAQSNFLMVEAYRRWVVAESNCRKLEKEVSQLRDQGGLSPGVKEKVAMLNANVSKQQSQVVETKELHKSSQASALAAFEARDKAFQDLEVANKKLAESEVKLLQVESRWKNERSEMQKAHDQLLANFVKMENERDEAMRSRDRISKAQQDTLAWLTDLISRYECETQELYGLVSELLLRKQWLLSEGAQWMV